MHAHDPVLFALRASPVGKRAVLTSQHLEDLSSEKLLALPRSIILVGRNILAIVLVRKFYLF